MTIEMLSRLEEKQTEILKIAEELYAQKPDWVTFFREVLGLGGIIRHTFPTRAALDTFEQSAAYKDILQMLTELRRTGPQEINPEEEPTKMITVRIPKSLHEALREEAFEYRTSINKLCISKLLQYIENEMVPEDK